MGAIQQIFFYISILIITFISGLWITVIFIPNKYNDYKLPITFLFGFIWLILISSWTSYLGFGFNKSSHLILLFSIVSGTISLYIEIKRKSLRSWVPSKFSIFVLFSGITSGILVLLPTVLYKGLYPYCDGFTYISIADYLLEHGFFEAINPNPYYPYLTQIKVYQDNGFRMGAQFFLALITSIFNRTFSLDVFMPVVAVSQFFLVLSVWLFCKMTLKLNNKASLVASIFTAFHLSIPINNAIQGFFPQAYGVVLMLLVFTFIHEVIECCDSKISDVIFASLAIAALIITYSELVPFVALSSFVLLLIRLIISKKDSINIIKNISIASIISVILSNIAFINMLKAIKTQMSVVVGWHIPYTIWDYVLLMFSLDPIYGTEALINKYPMVYMIIVLAGLAGIYIISKGFIHSQQWKFQKKLLLSLSSSFILMLIYFKFFVNNPWTVGQKGHTWNIFKVIQYCFVLFPPIIGMAYYEFSKNNKFQLIAMRSALVGYICLSLVFNISYAYRTTNTMRLFTGNNNDPVGEYYKLYDRLKDEKKVINIIVPSALHKHRQMIVYILQKNKLVSDWTTDIYLQTMNSIPLQKEAIMLVFDPNAEDKVANMDILRDRVYLAFDSGVYGLESNDTETWNWCSEDADILAFNPMTEQKEIIMKFGIGLPPGISGSKTIEIIQDNIKMETLQVEASKDNNYEIKLSVKPGQSKIIFKYNGEIIKVGSDPRELTFSFINFTYDTLDI